MILLDCSCKEYQNLDTFYAVVMGLNNVAVSRLRETWEKLPMKLRKMSHEFENMLDPCRNHRYVISSTSEVVYAFCKIIHV